MQPNANIYDLICLDYRLNIIGCNICTIFAIVVNVRKMAACPDFLVGVTIGQRRAKRRYDNLLRAKKWWSSHCKHFSGGKTHNISSIVNAHLQES